MKKMAPLFIVLFILFNLWAGVSIPKVAGEDIESTTITLEIGETTTYQYFNITLLDINPVSGTVLLNVTGIQGSKVVTIEDTYTDIFGDGTIEIKAIFVSSLSKEASLKIKVDLEALAGVACDILSSKLSEVREKNLLPPDVLEDFEKDFKLCEEYKKSGWYDDAVDLAFKTLNNLDTTVKIATEANKAIIDAKKALNDPSSVSPGCQECPSSIQNKVRDKINKAEEYYNQGNFEDALQYAKDAIQLIKDCCESCKVFPTKKESLLDYLKKKTTGIPSNLFNAVYKKIDEAQKCYDNGDCVCAINYLDDAKNMADSIITNWNEAIRCRNDLLRNIAVAKKNYQVVYNNTIIRIYLDDIEKKVREDLYNTIKSGYFPSAMEQCHRLADNLESREKKFNETKSHMENALKHIKEIQGQGYKVGPAWSVFNEGISLMESGDYEDAQSKFMEASNTADSIKQYAIEAQKAKNETLKCLNQLEAEGISVQEVFGEDMKEADELYDNGKYRDSKNKWIVIHKRCSDPKIKGVIELRKKAHEKLDNLTAQKIPVPKDLISIINKADATFKGERPQSAEPLYQEVISKLDYIKDIDNRMGKTITDGKKFLEQNHKWGMNVAKWFGIPIVKERLETLNKLINKTLEDRQSIKYMKDYEKVEQDLEEINSLMKDIDGDNVKNWNDPVPYVPNYYLVGLIVALALIFLNVLR